jgi:hypothetical protein
MAKESLDEVIEDSETDSLNSETTQYATEPAKPKIKKIVKKLSLKEVIKDSEVDSSVDKQYAPAPKHTFENIFMLGLIPGGYISSLVYSVVTHEDSLLCCLCGNGGWMAPFYGIYLATRFWGFRI